MSMNNPVRAAWALVAIIACVSVPAAGQQLEMRVDPERLYVGDAATLQIVIPDAGDDVDPIQLAPVPGLTIQYVGSGRNTQMSFINGRQHVVNELTLNYSVSAAAAGEYEIPAQRVTVGGDMRTTTPITLHVLDPPNGKSDLQADIARDHVYVGEPVRLTLTWLVGESVQQGFRIYSGIDSNVFDDLSLPATPAANDVMCIYDNQRVSARQGVADRSDGRYPTVTIERVLIPQQPGSYELGPARVRYDAIVDRRGFGLLERNITEPRVAEAAPVMIDVRPLPLEGRPTGFTGLVGDSFKVSSSVSVSEVNVGDPIELTVHVHGDPPLGRVRLPSPGAMPGFDEFKMADEWEVEDASNDDRVFKTTIRASSEDVMAVPPVSLAYFNTESGGYETASSDAVPLTVRQTREVTAADAVGGGGAGPAASRAVEELGQGAGGVLAITVSDAALVHEHAGLGDVMSRPWLIAAIIFPGVVPIAVALAARVRHGRGSQWRRRKQALRRALGELRAGGEPARCVERAIRAYVADRFDRLQDALTYEDCRSLLLQEGSSRAEEVGKLLAACARVRFGGDAPQPNVQDARRLLIALERGR